jgi:transcriptional regulator with XRE-family HTH domain
MSRLREVRVSKGLKQREVAEMAHTCQSLVSALELEKLKPWPAIARRLSEALGSPVSELFPEDKELAKK